MVQWNSATKRWKKAADEAIGPNRLGEERDRLAAEVAKRIWVANGGRDWADVRGEGSLLALELLVLRHLNDGVVRSVLALRYLTLLEQNLLMADYEDTRSMEDERRWSEEYLAGSMQCSLSGDGESSRSALSGTAGDRLECVRTDLTALLMAELKAAAIAAA